MRVARGETRFARVRRALERLTPTEGLPAHVGEFLIFGFKQGWACLFGALMPALLLATHFLYPAGAPLARYDFLPDIRLALSVATAGLYARTVIVYRPFRADRRMPMLLGFLLVALFIWLAENVGTFSNAWLYPGQRDGWHLVGPEKLGAWFLLMIISFVLVSLVHRPRPAGAHTLDRAPLPALERAA